MSPDTELRTVIKLVIAGVGTDWGHSLAQPAALLTLSLDVLVPAVALGQVGAVAVGVLAVWGVGSRGLGGCGRYGGACGSRARAFGTGDSDDKVTETTYNF